MSVIGSNILAGAAGAAGAAGYEISRSLRFNSGDSSYLSRTPSSGDRRTWTWSGWVKRSELTTADANNYLFSVPDSGGHCSFYFSADKLRQNPYTAANGSFTTNAVFRDPSAWYHVVYAYDSTQSTATDRIKLYVNGVQQTFSAYSAPTQNQDSPFSSASAHYIGKHASSSTYSNFYLADVHFIDGQALAATDFGEFDADTGVWNPIEYSGTYGTNGFHLDFSDNSSNAALGNDAAGSNNWTVNYLTASEFGAVFLDGDTSDLTGSPYNATYALAHLFDSNKTNRIAAAGNSTIVYAPSSAITADKFRFHYQLDSGLSGFGLKVNDVDYTSSLSAGSNKQIDINVQTLTKVEIRTDSSNQWLSLYYIEKLFEGAGAGTDSLIDTPTNYEADSGNNGGNYATLNPLNSDSNTVLSNGNLTCDKTGTNGYGMVTSTMGVSSGKWYCEYTLSGGETTLGIARASTNVTTGSYMHNSGGVGYYSGNGYIYDSGTTAYGATFTTGDTIGIALDLDNGKVFFSKNGTFQNSGDPVAGTNPAASGLSDTYVFGLNGGSTSTTATGGDWNFGQRPFAYTPPTGYVSLCTENLSESAYASIPDGSTAFDAITYQGTGSNRSITGLNMSPDFLWIKARTSYQGGNQDHALFDKLRGTGKQLRSNTTGAETSNNYGVTAFNSDGFSLHGSFSGPTNGSHAGTATEYVAWAWDAGDDANPTSISAGSSNSSFYDQSQTWSTYGSASSGGYASGLGIARGFNGDLSTQVEGDTTGAYFSIPFSTTIASGDVGFVSYASSGDGRMKLYNGSSEVDDVGSSGNSQFRYSTYAGAITEIRISRNGRAFEFAAVSVFGKILVDSNQTPPNKPSIPSDLRANQSTGFSIISYTGNNTSGATVGHGLNKRPDFIIAKSRDTSQNWLVFHSSFGASYHSDLNFTGGFFSGGSKWTSTEPTSSMFSIATDGAINASGIDYIAYAWTAVEGYSAFGSYTGNGSSDGTFVYTGFKVKFLIIKQDGTNGWFMWDTKRDSLNPNTALFSANASNTEQSQANHAIDFLSNGFKTRDSNGAFNGSGNDYVYIAFAEHPFKTARAR